MSAIPILSAAGADLRTARNLERDKRDQRPAQLVALTAIINGTGFETFSTYNDDIQGNVLWLVHDLASEVDRLTKVADGAAKLPAALGAAPPLTD